MSLNGLLIREKMAVISLSGGSICSRLGLLIEGEGEGEGLVIFEVGLDF